jgi:hypothetical protein
LKLARQLKLVLVLLALSVCARAVNHPIVLNWNAPPTPTGYTLVDYCVIKGLSQAAITWQLNPFEPNCGTHVSGATTYTDFGVEPTFTWWYATAAEFTKISDGSVAISQESNFVAVTFNTDIAYVSYQDFGAVNVGSTADLTLKITNVGVAAFSVSGISVTGSDFSQVSTTCSGSLAVGANCGIVVRFTPSTAGNRSGTLAFTSSFSGAKTAQLVGRGGSGTGGGTGGQVTLSPATLDFGSVVLGKSSSAQTFTLSASGGTTVGTIALAGNTADFPKSNDLCSGKTLAAGGSCSFIETFTPKAAGSRSASISIPVTGSTVSGSLSGTGAAAGTVTLSPATLDFGSVNIGSSSPAKTFTLSNTTTSSQLVHTAALSGTNANQFKLSNDGCSGKLLAANNGSCNVQISFGPTSTGAKTATLSITFDDQLDDLGNVIIPAYATQTASLSGSSSNPVNTLTISTAAIAFGTETIGVKTSPAPLSISNFSSVDLPANFSALTGTNPSDFAVTTNCPSTLPVGQSCSASVTFTPSVNGAESASFFIGSGNFSGFQVQLTGTERPADLTARVSRLPTPLLPLMAASRCQFRRLRPGTAWSS